MTASEGDAPRSIADLALDVLVYGPAGVLITAASDMPAMAAKGKERIEQELRNAHVVGRFVVDAGMRQVRGQLGSLLREQPERPRPGRTPAPTTGAAPFTGAAAPGPSAGAPARDAAVDRAIPDYDTLSASQVVRRLDGLKARELRAIVRHELANRGRRTILNRAEQLLGETPPAAPPAAT